MIKRHAKNVITELSKMFSCIMVTGARQVGKTTLLQDYGKKFQYLTFDNPALCDELSDSGINFLERFNLPIILDEVQYVPEIFRYIKIQVDKLKKKGIIYISGSQQFKMMKNVSESLAGRVGIINISTLSNREINGEKFHLPFVPIKKYFDLRKKEIHKISEKEEWHRIYRGAMPELVANRKFDEKKYYSTYVSTYIERDVRDLTQVGDERIFSKFMVALAARTGQMLNKSSIADEIGVSIPTIDRWISILENSNIIYLLYPYANNQLKRMVKTPKIYFLDTGLCVFLTKWDSYRTLMDGAMSGSIFETYVISEIIKSYFNEGITDPPLYYYRDKDMVEIDLLIEKDNTLFPVEIKKYTNYNGHDVKKFQVLNKIKSVKIGSGGVICMYDNLVPLIDNNYIIPINYI